MDNGMDSMLDMYLFETNSLLAQLEDILIAAEQDKDFTTDHINEIFRIMHTIKGSSAMMEFSSLMSIAHRIEDLFFFIREKGMDRIDETHRRELFDLVFQSVDYISSEIGRLENGEPFDNNIDPYIDKINRYLDKINGEQVEQEEAQAGEAAAAQELYQIRVFFDEGIGMENLRAFMLLSTLRDLGLEPSYLPSDVESNPETAHTIVEEGFVLGFDTEEARGIAAEALQHSVNIREFGFIDREQAPKQEQRTEQVVEQTASVPEHEELPKQTEAPQQTQTNYAGNKQSLISVNLSKLDQLMAIVGEIVITESMVTASPDLEGLKLENFTKAARQLRKLNDELQDIAMSLRMVPVSGVFQKMNRIVRDMSKKLDKDAKLIIEGEDTEVDKSIVDHLGDPLMHIVRNSMDHGLEESAQDRIKAGKDPQGTIVLSASHTGSEVLITITDDGRGIDTERVLDKAESRGMLVKPRSEYTQKEAIALVMSAGFSTNDSVTEFSGRGVGMDVVRKNIETLGGTLTMQSVLGEGSQTILKIPLTLAIVSGMKISVGRSTFTIPITNIRQSLKVDASEVIRDTAGREMIKKMDTFLPIVRLHEIYGIASNQHNIEDGILIWVESGDTGYCLFVDELVGEHQVVVKPLPSYLSNFSIKNSGIAGCSIMGDGNISLILDIPNLYTFANSMY